MDIMLVSKRVYGGMKLRVQMISVSEKGKQFLKYNFISLTNHEFVELTVDDQEDVEQLITEIQQANLVVETF